MSEKPNLRQAAFLTSAARFDQCPEDTGTEVAFAGRSNAGKSSALNALCGNRKLARTSKTPGRTQQINFFTLGRPDYRMVDLPGYGYARVEKALKAKWDGELERYLRDRKSLVGLVLLMDIRHPFKDYDRDMLQWAVDAELPVQVLLTKADKLSRNQALNAESDAREALGNVEDLVSVQAFSATRPLGLDALNERLDGWFSTVPARSAPGPE